MYSGMFLYTEKIIPCACKYSLPGGEKEGGDVAKVVQHHQEETRKKLGREYHCPTCNQDLYLTGPEILKHKKSCAAKPP